MIDPHNITNFNRTDEELEEFLLFCILVHGKRAEVQALKLEQLLMYLSNVIGESSPFRLVDIAINTDTEDESNLFLDAAKKFKVGQYERLIESVSDLIQLGDLKSVTVEQLENCFGIGPKTARFFIVHSRPNQQHAVLDTHILRWMRGKGIETPTNTPQGKKYAEFEKKFLTFVADSGMSVAEFDLNIWKTAQI